MLVWRSVLYSVDKMTKITQWWIFKNLSLLLAGARWCVRSLHICVHMWMCICMYVCIHLWGGVCECYCLCVHVCVCLASAPLQISNAPSSAPQQVPLGASGGDTASAVNMSEYCRVKEEIPVSSCSVSISHFSVPRGTLMVRKEVILSHCLPQRRFVLRRLIFSGRINSSPRWSLKARSW